MGTLCFFGKHLVCMYTANILNSLQSTLYFCVYCKHLVCFKWFNEGFESLWWVDRQLFWVLFWNSTIMYNILGQRYSVIISFASVTSKIHKWLKYLKWNSLVRKQCISIVCLHMYVHISFKVFLHPVRFSPFCSIWICIKILFTLLMLNKWKVQFAHVTIANFNLYKLNTFFPTQTIHILFFNLRMQQTF